MKWLNRYIERIATNIEKRNARSWVRETPISKGIKSIPPPPKKVNE